MLQRFCAIVLASSFLLSVTSVDLHAQRGFRSGGGAAVVRTAPSVPAPAFVGRPAPIVRPPVVASPFVAPVGRFPHNPGFVRQPRTIVVPQPFGIYPSYYSPYLWSSSVVAPVYAEPVYTQSTAVVTQGPVVSQNEVELSYQVGRLSQEIDQLRQEQAQRSLPPAPALPATPTVLIFRDGHRLEVVNYAIVGDTFWALDERTSTKISIADLDLDATQKENRGRGLRFPLPAR